MGSLVALYIRARDIDSVVAPIGDWLGCHGFGASQRLEAAPGSLQTFDMRANLAALGRLNDEWMMVDFNGFTLDRRFIDEDVVRPLAARLTNRLVFFAGQTTSDAYRLVVFEAGKRLRSVAVSDGECHINEGPPLPGERTLAFSLGADPEGEADDAPSPLDDAAAVCLAMGFELWPESPLQGGVHVWRRRSLISRLLGR